MIKERNRFICIIISLLHALTNDPICHQLFLVHGDSKPLKWLCFLFFSFSSCMYTSSGEYWPWHAGHWLVVLIDIPGIDVLATSSDALGTDSGYWFSWRFTISSFQNLVMLFLSTSHVKVIFLFYICVGANFICYTVFLTFAVFLI